MSILDKEITVGQYAWVLAVTLVFGVSVAGHFAYEGGYDEGVSQGEREFAEIMEESDPTLVFRQGTDLNREIGISWEGSDLSYGCQFNGRDEVRTGELTFEYGNQTSCRFVEGDVAEAWDDEDFENQPVKIGEDNRSGE